MRLKRGRVVTSAVGVVAATFWFGQAPDRSVVVTEQASDVQTDPLPAGFDRDLASSGISYTVLGDPTEQQVRAAREGVFRGFGGILDEDGTAVVMRVRFTDTNFGHVDDPDAPNPTVTPYYVDREALVVVLTRQTMAISHPAPVHLPQGVKADFPESVEGTFVTFVDMKSNEVLRAVSWGS